MTMARAELVDSNVTRWYHCLLRCVRLASLLGQGDFDRKQWIENRLEELAGSFAVSVAGFAVLDNQFHVLARLDLDVAAGWSDEEVVRRWARVLPPRGTTRTILPDAEKRARGQLQDAARVTKGQEFIPVTDAWVRGQLQDAAKVALARQRLASLSWFMKCLKEPLSRKVNRQEGARGSFFEGRFRSVAILDDNAVLATCVYVDLAPVAAGLASTPKTARYTSIKCRLDHAAALRRAASRNPPKRGARAAARPPDPEESLWLCPIDDRHAKGSTREGMIAGITLDDYMLLLDFTGRLFREGQAPVSRPLKALFARLEIEPETWSTLLLRLNEGRLFGRFFASSRDRLRDVGEQLGLRRMPNLGGWPPE